MEEKIFPCKECERDFKSEDALRMHNSSKHSPNLEAEKVAKISPSKIKNWLILAVILGLIFYGIFWAVGNMNGNTVVNEEELNFDAPTSEIHWHPVLTIKINDEIIEIPSDIGITSSVHFPTHTHEDSNVGVLHMENDRPTRKTVTLGYFFEVWRKTFNKDCIFDYCTDEGELKMYVNEVKNFEFEKYFMQDNDEILIEYNSFN